MRNAQDSEPRRGAAQCRVALDPEEAQEIVRPRRFRFVPRSRGPFRVETRRIAVGGVELRVERTVGAMLVDGGPAEGTQSVFSHRPTGGAFRYAGRDVEADRACLTHSGEGWRGVLPERFEACTVGFETEALRRYCADLGERDPGWALSRSWILPRAPHLPHRVHALMRTAEASPPGVDARGLEAAAFDHLLSVLVPREPGRRVRVSAASRRRALKRAVDYALAHLGAPARVADLCRAAGTSVRTLEYAFREAYDATPAGFLKAARLSRARLELLRGSREKTTVLQVAVHWGFHDPARFARDYALWYGESPSATLRRAAMGSAGRAPRRAGDAGKAE
jgi:AraC-like DNA-binding protein